MFIRRQIAHDPTNNQGDDENDWWFLSTAYNLKWAIAGGIVLLLFLLFTGGYVHAKRRMRKGLRKSYN